MYINDIRTQDELESYFDDIYANTDLCAMSRTVDENTWNRLYVLFDQTESYLLFKGFATLELVHSRGVFIVINKDYK